MTNLYNTTDLPLAAYLTYRGHRISDIVRDGNRCTFVIAPCPEDEIVNDFFIGKATVNPLEYFSKIKGIKNLIYNH